MPAIFLMPEAMVCRLLNMISESEGCQSDALELLGSASAGSSMDARIAALAVKGEIQTPERPLMPRIRRVKVAGGLLSKQIIADRR